MTLDLAIVIAVIVGVLTLLAATAPREFDADVYRIARKSLVAANALALVELAGD